MTAIKPHHFRRQALEVQLADETIRNSIFSNNNVTRKEPTNALKETLGENAVSDETAGWHGGVLGE